MKSNTKPNILYIMTDQQTAHMMSCAGTEWVNTPNLDKIAEKGIRYRRAYCTNPVCVPSRFSLFTGRYPEAIGMRSNDYKYLPKCDEAILANAMGNIFKKSGYDCFYAGKKHFPGYTPEDIGFEVVTNEERDELANITASFLKAQHDKPWLYVASFINPHDVCYKAIVDDMEANSGIPERYRNFIEYKTMKLFDCIPEGIDEDKFFKEICPPLPDNNKNQENKPAILEEFLKQRGFKKYTAENYTDKDWRMHRYIYKELTELVDNQIGVVLDALEDSGNVENTLVVFTSDHGDLDGSHLFEHKTLLYEEAINIPLLISHPGSLPEGITTDVIASNGIDLYPSLLEYAGIKVPDSLNYVNCINAAISTGEKREYLAVESEISRGIVSDKLKYVMYDFGKNNEQLYDYVSDPGELRNHINRTDLVDEVALLRKEFNHTWDEVTRKKHLSPLLITDYTGKV